MRGISKAGWKRLSQFLSTDPAEILTITFEDFVKNPIPGYILGTGSEDANANNPNNITLTRKFFSYPEEARKHILIHENAHYIVDSWEKSPSFWSDVFSIADAGGFGPKDEEGILIEGINGQYTPLENLVEGVAVYQEEPEWLKEHYPIAYQFIKNHLEGV